MRLDRMKSARSLAYELDRNTPASGIATLDATLLSLVIKRKLRNDESQNTEVRIPPVGDGFTADLWIQCLTNRLQVCATT